LKRDIGIAEVRQICAGHQIEVQDSKALTGSFGKNIFFINQEFLLRVSETSMALEQEKFRRIATLNFVPKICYTGTLPCKASSIYYTLLTLLPGDDLVNAYLYTTPAQQSQLGADVAQFLDSLHEIGGAHYDIGLYVPALPPFSGTWREGHQAYWELLKQGSKKIPLQPDSLQVFEKAFQFLHTNSPVLEYQSGPKLLHNDFHPKNILVDRGNFSGVIDWECSQFGEADFELCHLIHWCLYPPKPDIDFRPFLRAFFAASPKCARVPNLTQRLTIYQIEHEIQQIIWSAGEAESWRVPRLARWLAGDAEGLFREIAS
jgi:aminoglycoside phosphotransferase (APT) family kinase protein